MAKDNLFLGFGRGKLGDVVFYRAGGQQVARARNRAPKNPQTAIQLLQRVLMKSASSAFSMLRDICDHSFQGINGATPNQSRFIRLNIAEQRAQLADIINSGDAEEIVTSTESNFSMKSTTLPPIRPYVVSEGTITPLGVSFNGTQKKMQVISALNLAAVPQDGLTYAQVCQLYGLQQGDQLTFLQLSCDDTEEGADGYFNGISYARVILEPSDGDMTKVFLSDGAINDPNPRNQGDVTISFNLVASAKVFMYVEIPTISGTEGLTNSLVAMTCIVSRYQNNIWQRSGNSLVLRSWASSAAGHLSWDHGTAYLGDAVASYVTGKNSSLYLNQAENF